MQIQGMSGSGRLQGGLLLEHTEGVFTLMMTSAFSDVDGNFS